MPLHLLGKKSWNVYNQDNIARVRRDEAEAEAREAAEEQAMQEADAQRRMKILRGEPIDDEPETRSTSAGPPATAAADERLGHDVTYGERDRKRKRRHGEDDTDRDLRYARRMVEGRLEDDEKRVVKAGKIDDDASLVDHAGNINLFPVKADRNAGADRSSKNDNGSKASRKKRDEDEVPVMRLTDAGGRWDGKDFKPWYSSDAQRGANEDEVETVRKDVWGKEDLKRKARDQARLTADDPLAAIRQGVQQVRKVESDRKKWRSEKDAEIRSLQEEEEQRRQRKHRRRHDKDRYQDDGDVRSFSLDARSSSGRHRGDRRRGSRHEQHERH